MTPYEGDPATFPASVDLPDDSDDRDVSALDVPLEACLDRTAYLKARGLIGHEVVSDTDLGAVLQEFGSTNDWEDSDTLLVLVSDCLVGDKIMIDFTGTYTSTGTNDDKDGRIVAIDDNGGAGETAELPVSGAYFRVTSASTDEESMVTMTGMHSVTVTGDTYVKVQILANSTHTLKLNHHATLRIQQWRAF